MKLSTSINWTKGMTYSLFILLVSGVFLMGYFYYYIPKNKRTIHKDGFLILQTIAGNIADKNDDRRSLFRNFVNEALTEHGSSSTSLDSGLYAHLDSVFEKHNIEASVQFAEKRAPARKGQLNQKRSTTTGLPLIDGEEFVYKVYFGEDSVVTINESIASFLRPVLATQKAELFDSYALSCIDSTRSTFIYYDPEIGIRADMRLDTLLTKKVQSYLAGVRDIESPEVNRKIFYYPFKVGALQLVLCGFTRLDLYQQTVRKVPFHFVYPLAITFMLLLIFLPILKFYIIDADEQVGVGDIVLFGLSVFVGASVLTLVGVQYILWQGGEANIRSKLKTLSHQIERSFVSELREAHGQMRQLDSLRAADGLLTRPIGKEYNYSDSIRRFVGHSLCRRPNYYHFDRISWIDNRDTSRNIGQQVIKGEMVGDPVFTNVRNRNYFRAFRSNQSLPLSSILGDTHSAGTFAWEPIYSHTKADFTITISKPTDANKYIVALASKMYSVVHALVPVGYGFCLIDGEGKVLVHSDVNRSLRENLFQKVEPADGLLGAVATRQATDLNDVVLYRNWHMLHVHPIRGLPYTLVTFYDKGYIVPVNMRILTFAFLFSLLSALMCLLLWLSLARTGLRNHPLLYCPMDCLTWLMPQQRQANFYGHGFVFLVTYGVGLLCFNLLQLPGDYNRFLAVLLTPINVICALFIIGATCRRYGPKSATQRPDKRVLLRVAMVHLLLTIGFYAASRNVGYPLGGPFLAFQIVCNGWMWFYAIAYGSDSLPAIPWIAHFQVRYSLMLTALVVCLAILPSALFSLHAYRQERMQTIKKQQLHLAADIRERSNRLMTMAGFSDPALVTGSYLEKRFTKLGIYTIDSSSVTLPDTLPANRCRASFDGFYFAVVENLSNRYYDPNRYPALADTTTDLSWWWTTTSDSMRLFYPNPLRERTATADTPEPRYMTINSALPISIYCLFVNGNKGVAYWLLTLLVSGLLLWGLYSWLYTNTERVFLLKYIYPQTPDQAGLKNLVARYRSFVLDGKEDKRIYHSAADDYYTTDRDPKNLAGYEKEVLQIVRKGEKFYEEIWNESSPKEKYLLNDFAQDGLLNYRNTREIHTLLERGVFIIRDERLKLFNPGFRAFLITKGNTNEVKELHTRFLQNSTWQSLQGPMMLLLVGFVSFVFFTQEEAFDKILALAGGVTTLLSLLPKFLGDNHKASSTTGSA